MKTKSLRRMLVLVGSIVVLVLAFAPVALAGEDGCDDDSGCGGGGGGASTLSGGSDTGSAVGGVQTGFGGMATSDSTKILLPMSLAGGGVLLLSIAGGLAVRRQNNQ